MLRMLKTRIVKCNLHNYIFEIDWCCVIYSIHQFDISCFVDVVNRVVQKVDINVYYGNEPMMLSRDNRVFASERFPSIKLSHLTITITFSKTMMSLCMLRQYLHSILY